MSRELKKIGPQADGEWLMITDYWWLMIDEWWMILWINMQVFDDLFGGLREFVYFWRTRQTLWGECTDANLKTVAKRYMIEKK